MKTDFQVIYSPESYRDLKEIHDYISCELRVPEVADLQLKNIRDRIASLSYLPLRHALIELGLRNELQLRRCIVDNYAIYYRVMNTEKLVIIFRVMYSRRNLDALFDTEL